MPASAIDLAGTEVTDLAALRAEIDALDDALHDLLMRRAQVVARLAASRAKGDGPAIRPGREAAILRRLLGRHTGALPRAALVRLWRELLAATTSMQGELGAVAWLPDAGIEVLRAHLGLASPIHRVGHEAQAVQGFMQGRAPLVALPLAGRWWRTHSPSALRVVARLPFFGPAEPTVFLLSPAEPDPSGEDLTLVRLPATQLHAAGEVSAAPPGILAREPDLLLVELKGMIAAGDVRLASLGATVLGSYAAPIPA